jgi:WD40 repeat protein
LLIGHEAPISIASFSRDGKKIVTGALDGTSRVYSAETGKELSVGHTGVKRQPMVIAAAFSPDGQKVLTAWSDKTAVVWRAEDGEVLFELAGHQDEIVSGGFTPDGLRIVTAAKDKTARIWNADGKGEPVVLKFGSFPYWSVSPDGSLLATSSIFDKVQIRKLDGSGVPLTLSLPKHAYELVWSPDGRRIALGYQNQDSLALWSADGQGGPTLLKPFSSCVRVIAWSENGARILVGAEGWGEPSALVWNADGRGAPLVLPAQDSEIISAALSPDGKTAITIGKNGSAWRWNLDELKSVQPSVLRKQLWSTTRFCPYDREHERALNRSSSNPDWDLKGCERMLKCLYGSTPETAQKADPYEDCLKQFRAQQGSFWRDVPSLF